MRGARRLAHVVWVLALAMVSWLATPTSAQAANRLVPVYRMYNTKTSEHLYTTGAAEYNACGKGAYRDWRAEGIGWYAPSADEGSPVYRLYNRRSGDHHYTTSAGERDTLVARHGWRFEQVAFYSADADDSLNVPLYRLYNGRLRRGQHHYTASAGERDALVAKHGWRYEQVGFYGLDPAYWDDGEITDEYLQRLDASGVIEVDFHDNGLLRTIDGTFVGEPVNGKADAALLIERMAPVLGIIWDIDVDAEMDVSVAEIGDGDFEVLYRYAPLFGDLPIIGSQVVVATDSDGTVTGLFNTYIPRVKWGGDERTISEQQAKRAVFEDLGYSWGIVPTEDDLVCSCELAVDAAELDEPPALVYVVRVANYLLDLEAPNAPTLDFMTAAKRRGLMSRTYYVYANDTVGEAGEIRRSFSNDQGLESLSAAGRTPAQVDATDLLGQTRTLDVTYGGPFNLYYLQDTKKGIDTYRLEYESEQSTPDQELVAFAKRPEPLEASAHANVEEAFDFYNEVLGRLSFDNRGGEIHIGISELSDGSPFWSHEYQIMSLGSSDGYAGCLDVVGHEFTHGVIDCATEHSGGQRILDYGEAGAVGEGYGDIMGSLIEWRYKQTREWDHLIEFDRWWMAEDSGTVARGLDSPQLYSDSYDEGEEPYRTDYDDRYVGQIDEGHDNGGVHVNSTILSHALYLMMVDARTSRVDDDRWAHVLYRSMFRLPSNARLGNARGSIISSARLEGFTDSELQVVKDAFDEVGLPEQAYGPQPDPDAPTPTPEPSNQTIFVSLTWTSVATMHEEVDLDAYIWWRDSGGTVHSQRADDTLPGYTGSAVMPFTFDEPGSYYFVVNSNTEFSKWDADVLVADGGAHTTLATFKTEGYLDKEAWWTVFRMDVDEDLNPTFGKVDRWQAGKPF